jgi:hypothetical protein
MGPPHSSTIGRHPRRIKTGALPALREKLQRKNKVVAELMEEHVKLKKGSSPQRVGNFAPFVQSAIYIRGFSEA